MSFFSRFSRKDKHSALRDLLQRMTPKEIQAAATRAKARELGVATLVSLTTLSAACNLGVDVAEAVRRLGKSFGAPHRHEPVFDIVVLETAAFVHFTLMAPYLNQDDDDEVDVDDAEDEYFAALRSSAHLSGGILTDHTDFEIPDDFFMHRVSSYSLAQVRRENLFEVFQARIAKSIEAGTPRAARNGVVSLDLPLTLGLTATVLPFCSTMLPALSTVARNAYDHADELGLVE